MKFLNYIVISIIYLLFCNILFSQILLEDNLVPNGSFEDGPEGGGAQQTATLASAIRSKTNESCQ